MNKIERTTNILKNLFLTGNCIVSSLSGKDSLCVTHLAVEALKQARVEQPSCAGILHIMTTNTTIDNFEFHRFILDLHKAAREYAIEYDLPIHTHEIKPSLMEQPLVEYIGHGKLLRTPQTTVKSRSCAINWKIEPAKKFIKQLQQQYQTNKIINLSGVRDLESQARKRNIALRNESIDALTLTELGYSLAPIKDWSLSDVWSLLGQIENDEIDSFIEQLAKQIRIHYSAGNGGICDVFANNKNSKPCSSRFGCTLCKLAPETDSLRNQIETSPTTYGYMQPLTELGDFMFNTLNNMEYSRSMLGRSVKDDFLKFGFNQYSLNYRKELLRYVLTIDANEQQSAASLNIKPRFELIDYQALIAIQYIWAKEGCESQPAEAIKIWHDVHTYNQRYNIPKTQAEPAKDITLSITATQFVMGNKLKKYRYVNLEELHQKFDSQCQGMIADDNEKRNFTCHIATIEGQKELVIPYKESNKTTIYSELAENYINETYFDLEADGIFDPENNIDPTVIVKDLLFNEVVTIRKGSMNKLHHDLKKAQLYNHLMKASRSNSSSIIDSIIYRETIDEKTFKITPKTKQNQNKLQMVMGF
jgi:DNA sulfur modification protein DndC